MHGVYTKKVGCRFALRLGGVLGDLGDERDSEVMAARLAWLAGSLTKWRIPDTASRTCRLPELSLQPDLM